MWSQTFWKKGAITGKCWQTQACSCCCFHQLLYRHISIQEPEHGGPLQAELPRSLLRAGRHLARGDPAVSGQAAHPRGDQNHPVQHAPDAGQVSTHYLPPCPRQHVRSSRVCAPTWRRGSCPCSKPWPGCTPGWWTGCRGWRPARTRARTATTRT